MVTTTHGMVAAGPPDPRQEPAGQRWACRHLRLGAGWRRSRAAGWRGGGTTSPGDGSGDLVVGSGNLVGMILFYLVDMASGEKRGGV